MRHRRAEAVPVAMRWPHFLWSTSALDWDVVKCSDFPISSCSHVEPHPQPTPCKHFPGINTLPSPPSLYYKHRFQSASMACNHVARRSVTRRHRMRRCQLRLLPPDNTGMKSALKVYGGMQRQSYREGAHRLRAIDMKQPHCHILRSDTMCCEALNLALATAQPRQYILEHIYISLWTSYPILRWSRL